MIATSSASRADRLEREISRSLRRCVARFLAGNREAAREAFAEARELVARRSSAAVKRIERERGLL